MAPLLAQSHPIYCASLGPSIGPEIWPGLLLPRQRFSRWPQDRPLQHTAQLQGLFSLPGEATLNRKQHPTPSQK